MRYLAILVLMALLVGCDLTRASAPPLVPQGTPLAAAQSTPLPHDPPAEPAPKREYIPAGLRVEGPISGSILDRFYRMAYLFPEVASRTKRIVARRAGRKGWTISYERTVIYLNVDKGVYVLTDALTEQFAKRAYAHLRVTAPGEAKRWKTWKVFAAWLNTGVR